MKRERQTNEECSMITVTKDGAGAVARVALDKKAQNVLLLEISTLVSYADYFLICSGRSSVQVKAIAEAIESSLRDQGIRPLHIEGATEARWILMDYDELIVHVFLEDTRQFYNLERLWNDAPCTVFEEGKS